MKKLLTILLLLLACLALFSACDEGTTEPPAQPPSNAGASEHTHTLTKHAATEATCTAAGNVEYWECEDCDKYFSDANATAEITDKTSVVIAASHELTHHAAVAKTCTTAGNIEYWECTECDKYFSDANATSEITNKTSVVVAASHEITHHVAVAKTCTTAGNIEYWECTECEKYFSDANATAEITEKSSVVIAASHELTHHAAAAKTCTAAGSIEYWECTECEKYFSDVNATAEITDKTSVVIAASHSAIWNYSDTQHWQEYTCACGLENSTPTAHQFNNNVCSVCQYRDGLAYTEYDTYAAVTGIGTASGDVKIASTYNGKPVTNIGQGAFMGCKVLTSITIPSSVTSIGSLAFQGCTELTSIIFSSGIPTNISYRVFEGCTGLTGIYITDLVAWCNSSFNVSNNSLTYDLYLNGTLVTNLVIPEGVMSIGHSAFSGCMSITSITIPSSVTSISAYAFKNCTGLASVTFEAGGQLESIGGCAFENCSGLTSITIPSSVTIIGSSAFESCTGVIQTLNGVSYVDKWVVGFDGSVTNVSLRSDTVGIGDSAFYYCTSLTSITIPSNVISIGQDAFYGCTGLTSVTFAENSRLTSIRASAFYGCMKLTSITIPSSVMSIDFAAFNECVRLFEVYNLSSLTITKNTIDNGCVGRYALNVYTPTEGERKVFTDANGYIFYVDSEARYLLGYLGSDTALVLPDGYNGKMYDIYESAFKGCTDLTSITIPSGVTSIGDSAFDGCTGLKEVTFENTDDWWVSTSSAATSGTSVDVSDPNNNATLLNGTYRYYYWKRG